jgi:hypothetical protein
MSELKITGNFAVVLDLHSNSSFGFLQFDGTLALPVKDAKKFHFPGEIRLVADDIFKKITDSLRPVLLSAQKNVKIIIPPPPPLPVHKVLCKSGSWGQFWTRPVSGENSGRLHTSPKHLKEVCRRYGYRKILGT